MWRLSTGSSPLSHVHVLRGIRPSMDIKRTEGPATGRRWSTMTRKIVAAARYQVELRQSLL